MKGLAWDSQLQDRKGEDATMNEKHRKHLAAFSESIMLALFGLVLFGGINININAFSESIILALFREHYVGIVRGINININAFSENIVLGLFGG